MPEREIKLVEVFHGKSSKTHIMPDKATFRKYADVEKTLLPGQTVRLMRDRPGGPALIVSTADRIIPL